MSVNDLPRKLTPSSIVTLYIHRTADMRKEGRNTFQKNERPRIEIKTCDGEDNEFIYIDELPQYIINNFEYGKGCHKKK